MENLPRETLTQIISYLPKEAHTLRLVSRGFRNCAWPAFSETLHDVRFDIRSMQSMQHLEAVARHTEIRPYMTSLCLTTGYVSPHVCAIKADLFRRLLRYRNSVSWMTHRYERLRTHRNLESGMEEVVVRIQRQSLVDFLAVTISRFTNLRSIRYEPDKAIHNFKPFYTDVAEAMETFSGDTYLMREEHHTMDIIGVDILISSLAAGGVKVRDLSVYVPFTTCRSLITYTNSEIVRQVFAHVDTLRINTLNMAFQRYKYYLPRENEVLLTRENLPKLTYLEWDGWLPFAEAEANDLHSPVPRWMHHDIAGSPPPIKHLDLLSMWGPLMYGVSFDGGFFNFLAKIGGTVKTITAKINFSLNWYQLIKFLAESPEVTLDCLDIELQCRTFCDMDKGFWGQEIPSRELLFQAAEVVTVRPEIFETWLKAHWIESERDAATYSGS
ncbi:hypothetical protein K491DRAFT_680744 [Lophiostoma macrostomum CBS 122681]|uniref:F-box domain-containing protein n=1 Tax=Lophiostoma macrostomum CBS 122681 TaxID=1314788 RepID=A0A6A6T3M4_9PLEO|nr:hypothetical protein K491DRAFT_680744 [Lophiostoma macrostomum CBS 122681]